MREIAIIKSQLLSFQKQILNDLRPYLVEKQAFLDADKWFNDSPNVFVYNLNGKLYISSEDSSINYISYLEKNNNYQYKPFNEFKVLPNEAFKVTVKGETMGKASIWLVLAEYSQQEKLNVHFISLNEKTEIRTTGETDKIRLGFRVSGTGIGIIEDVEIERVKEEFPQQSWIGAKYRKEKAPKRISDIKMACILDEFSMACFGQELNLITFTPENWVEVLSENKPDILFVESAWRGNHGSWEYKIAKYKDQDKEPLTKLLRWSKENGIPTVFWNKEDPVHFEKFIDTAKLFDYIFTTDANMIKGYQAAVGHNNVFALPFAAEPKLHNPIKIQEKRIGKICFAGSFYANRHEERRVDMENMLDVAAKFGLDIYDRNYSTNVDGTNHFSFPERFSENIVGNLKYDEIDKAYKGYRVMLNVNSVKNSPTMFSRRVFEGLACGTPIVSSYSEGIRRVFRDIVLVTEDKQELEHYVDKLMDDEEFYRQKSLDGIREVYLKHTYKHRIQYMLKKIGISISLNPKRISVISVVRSKDEFFYVLEQFKNQTWKEKELVIFVELFEDYIDLLNDFNNENVRTFVLSYMDHYSRLTELVNNEYVAYFSPKNFYGENYLLDLMIATEYSEADIIGKCNLFLYENREETVKELNREKEYEYVSELDMDASIMKVDIFRGEDIIAVLNKMIDGSSTSSYFRKGARLLSIDKYNFLKLGFSANQSARNKIEK